MTDNRHFNTGETQQQLREEYNPDGSPLRKAQMRMLDMLDYIDTICREQGIEYRLDSGNVIGAVRHGGFIPWDDDIDIALSMTEYRRLCRYLHEHPHPQYAIQSPKTDRNYLYPWNKLRDKRTEYVMNYQPGSKDAKVFEQQMFKGLQIDIFPFEDHMLPRLQRLAGKMACVAIFDIGKSHPKLARLLFVFNMYIAFPLFRLMNKLFGKSSCVMHAYGTWFYKQYDKQTIVPYREIQFEDRRYPAPVDCEAFCRTVYGHFEELPPRDKREWHAKDIIFR